VVLARKSGQLPRRRIKLDRRAVDSVQRIARHSVFAHGGGERHRQDRRVQDGDIIRKTTWRRFRPARPCCALAARARRTRSLRARARRAESHTCRRRRSLRPGAPSAPRRPTFCTCTNSSISSEPVRCARVNASIEALEKGERADGPRRHRAGARGYGFSLDMRHKGPDRRGRGDVAGERVRMRSGSRCINVSTRVTSSSTAAARPTRGAPGDRDAGPSRHRRNAAAEALEGEKASRRKSIRKPTAASEASIGPT